MHTPPSTLPWFLRDARPARITGGTGPYSWVSATIKSDGTTIDDPDTMTGTGSLYDLNGDAHVEGEIVWIKQAPARNAGAAIWVIVSGNGSTMIPVSLTWDAGGSDGNATTPVSWTYTATSLLDGVTTWTSMSPAGNRWKVSNVRKATIGWIRISGGVATLWALDEIFDFGNCEAPA